MTMHPALYLIIDHYCDLHRDIVDLYYMHHQMIIYWQDKYTLETGDDKWVLEEGVYRLDRMHDLLPVHL